MHRKSFTSLLVVAAFTACNPSVKQYESDATEAVVRQLLRDGETNSASVFFLAFGYRHTAPSNPFLMRFADYRPPIKSYAASSLSPNGDIVDTATGKIGTLLQIAKVDRKSSTEFDVEAALSSLPLNSNRFVYTVVQQRGRWVIRGRRAL